MSEYRDGALACRAVLQMMPSINWGGKQSDDEYFAKQHAAMAAILSSAGPLSSPEKVTILFDGDNAPRSVIGTSGELKSMSRRMAIPYFAGIAAELFYLGIPFTAEAFSDSSFHDFAVARWILSLTDSEADSLYCARVAYGLVMAHRSRVEYLARRLLEDGAVLSAKEI